VTKENPTIHFWTANIDKQRSLNCCNTRVFPYRSIALGWFQYT